MSIQDQYTEAVAASQKTWADVTDLLVDSTKKVLETATPSTVFDAKDATAAVDQFFSLWTSTLSAQREATQQILTSALAVGEGARENYEDLASTLKAQVSSAQRTFEEPAVV